MLTSAHELIANSNDVRLSNRGEEKAKKHTKPEWTSIKTVKQKKKEDRVTHKH